jgi:hypothetical protein
VLRQKGTEEVSERLLLQSAYTNIINPNYRYSQMNQKFMILDEQILQLVRPKLPIVAPI